MALEEAHVRRLVMWWAMQTEPGEDLLAEHFTYVSHAERHGRNDFLRGARAQAQLQDVLVLAIVVGSNHAAAFFEGLDPVTALRHRTGWLIAHEGGLVNELTVVDAVLPP